MFDGVACERFREGFKPESVCAVVRQSILEALEMVFFGFFLKFVFSFTALS